MSEAREAAERAYPHRDVSCYRGCICHATCRLDGYERGYDDAMAKRDAEKASPVVTYALQAIAWAAFHKEYARDQNRKYSERNKSAMRAALEAALSVKGEEGGK